MSSSATLYTRLFERLRATHPDTHLKRIANWVWIVVGLIQSQSVHLSQIALHIPSEAKAAGRIAQVRRWLANKFINVTEFYEPLITEVLKNWAGKPVFIILDGCSVNHEALQFFRLSLSHCFRALPLAWLVVQGPGLIQMEVCATLLEQAARLLALTASVTFLADRGFRDTDWAGKCLQLGWHYLIRVANNTYVILPDGRQLRIEQLGVRRAPLFSQRPLDQREGVRVQLDGHLDESHTEAACGAVCRDYRSAPLLPQFARLLDPHAH